MIFLVCNHNTEQNHKFKQIFFSFRIFISLDTHPLNKRDFFAVTRRTHLHLLMHLTKLVEKNEGDCREKPICFPQQSLHYVLEWHRSFVFRIYYGLIMVQFFFRTCDKRYYNGRLWLHLKNDKPFSLSTFHSDWTVDKKRQKFFRERS
jgi:hypothetical protein